MNWNPMMGQPWDGGLMPQQGMPAQSPDFGALAQAFAQQQPMGGRLPQNTLGASGVTLGNPQAQDQYAEMAQALAQHNRAQQQQEMAAAMMQPKYAENSGGLGSLAMMVQAYAGKKLAKRADENDIAAREKFYLGEEAAAERKAQREADREMAQRTQRAADAEKYGLQGDARTRYILEGKMGESPRDRLQALEGVNGIGVVNLDQNTVRYAQPEDAQPEGYKVTYAPGASAEDRAAVDAAARAAGWPSDPHGDVVDVGRVRPQPTGQFVTAAAAQRAQQDRQQAATNARLDSADQRDAERLRLAQEEAARKAAEAAKNAASQENQPSALRQDAINFAAAYIGKSPEDVAKMTPEQIRTAVASGGRWMTGPVMGRIPGAGATFNADLDAYSSSAAAKQARINNPTGTVTNADFIAAEKGVFSATKPPEVNADLIYQTLTGGAGAAPQAPAQPDATGGLSAQEQAELDSLRKRFGHK